LQRFLSIQGKLPQTSFDVSLFNSDNSDDDVVDCRSNCFVNSCCSAYCTK